MEKMTNVLAYLSLREKGCLLPSFMNKVVVLARPTLEAGVYLNKKKSSNSKYGGRGLNRSTE